MKEVVPAALAWLLYYLQDFNQSNGGKCTQYDMKSVTDNINKSLAKLTGGNSSDLLDNYNSLYK